MMGGVLDWGALPLMVELFGVDELEVFIDQLVAIRDNKK